MFYAFSWTWRGLQKGSAKLVHTLGLSMYRYTGWCAFTAHSDENANSMQICIHGFVMFFWPFLVEASRKLIMSRAVWLFYFAEVPSTQYRQARFHGHHHRNSYIPTFLCFGALLVCISIFMAIARKIVFFNELASLVHKSLGLVLTELFFVSSPTTAKSEH